ncbi:MAG: AAA family ATPase [Phocaeicola sp.]
MKTIKGRSGLGSLYVISGGPQSGKTTKASELEKVLFLGWAPMVYFPKGSTVYLVKELKQMRHLLKELGKMEVQAKYKTIVFDDLKQSLKVFGDEEKLSFFVDAITELGYDVVVIKEEL